MIAARGVGRCVALVVVAMTVSVVASGCFGPFRTAYNELPSLSVRGVPEELPPVRIAILPAAYAGATEGRACELCPADITLVASANAEHAHLVTAFFYEQLARHPRFKIVDHVTTEQLAAGGMDAAVAALKARDLADAVVVLAVVELQERIGSAKAPEQTAGLDLYGFAMRTAGGDPLWVGRFDEEEGGQGAIRSTIRDLVVGGERRWMTAAEYTGVAVSELVDDLVDDID